jgi:hypothetical protein
MNRLFVMLFAFIFLNLNAQNPIEFEHYFIDTQLVNKRISSNGYLEKFQFSLIEDKVLLIDNGRFLLKNAAKIKLSESFLPTKEELEVYKANFGIDREDFMATIENRVFEKHRYFIKSKQIIKQVIGSSEFSFASLEYEHENSDDIVFDKTKRRVILNGREGDKYFYTIVSIDDLTILAQGKGHIHVSPISNKYYVQKDFDLYRTKDFATLVEMDSENFKATKKLKGENLHYDYSTKLFDFNLDGKGIYDFDLIKVGDLFVVLARNKDRDNLNYHYLLLAYERNAFFSATDKLLYYKSENKIITKNLLNGEEKSVLESEYLIHDIHINSDSTKIILFLDYRNPTEKKAKEIAAEKERLRLIQAEEEKKIAEEKERLRLIKEEEDKKIAAEKERLRLIQEEKDKIVAAEQERLRLIQEAENQKIALEAQRIKDIKDAENRKIQRANDSLATIQKIKNEKEEFEKRLIKLFEKKQGIKEN